MMSFEEYKEYVKKEIGKYLPEQYKDKEVTIRSINKVNQSLAVLVIATDNNISPSIYLDSYYHDIYNGEDVDNTVKNIANMYVEAANKSTEVYDEKEFLKLELNNPEYLKKYISFQLINTDFNQNLLKEIPHREVMDLSLIYRLNIIGNNNVTGSIMVRNDYLERNNMTEQQLFDAAMEKAKSEEIELKNFANMFAENEDFSSDEFNDQGMYILTNKTRENGAYCMVTSTALRDLAEKLESNLYILPSSIHEVIVIKENDQSDEKIFEQMVYEVNNSQLKLEERLSNNVYKYVRETGNIIQVTQSPYDLDGEERRAA